MSPFVRARNHLADEPDAGVFAILYAVLVVVLVTLAAIVVDLASVREDRRLNRASADSSAIAGATKISALGGYDPRAACDLAWAYLVSNEPGLSKPGNACNSFDEFVVGNAAYVDPAAYCTSGTEIRDVTDAGGLRVTVSWPVASTSTFLQPDLAPGNGTLQPYDAAHDGASPCNRLGVAIAQQRTFGLGSVAGVRSISTEVHSVALNVVKPGPSSAVAALNILDKSACQALQVSGQGEIVVNRSNTTSGGIVAVESSGSACSNGNKFAIDLSATNSNKICASGAGQVPNPALLDPNLQCDGLGTILSHAKDSSITDAYAYPPLTVSGTFVTRNLRPTPTAEGGVSGWAPVTDIYGCQALAGTGPAYSQCLAPKPQYIPQLVAAYGGDGTVGNAVVPLGPYTGSSDYHLPGSTVGPSGTFTSIPGAAVPDFTCNGSKNVYIPTGNWFVNCPDSNNQAGFSINPGGIVVFGGGNIVFRGGIAVAGNPSCLAINVPLGLTAGVAPTSCPDVQFPGTNAATTIPPPAQDAQVFLRGSQGLTTGSQNTTLRMPQTFVYQLGTGKLALSGGGNNSALWTAPGAGAPVGGVQPLADLCTPAGGQLSDTCMDSRFSRIAYWNESTAPTTFTGAASLNLVGVFFTPRSDVNYGGQTAYAGSASAQFWANTLNLSGQANLVLTPDPNLSIKRPVSSVVLIR